MTSRIEQNVELNLCLEFVHVAYLFML